MSSALLAPFKNTALFSRDAFEETDMLKIKKNVTLTPNPKRGRSHLTKETRRSRMSFVKHRARQTPSALSSLPRGGRTNILSGVDAGRRPTLGARTQKEHAGANKSESAPRGISRRCDCAN